MPAPGLGSPDCNGDAVVSESVPLQGVSCQSGSAFSASLAAHLHSGGLRCQMRCRSAIRTRGRGAVVTAAQGTSWWLWESLDLTSDLGKALTRKKDTASSYVNSYCRLCSPRPSASGCRQRGGRWPVGRGRLGGHLAMVSTVNTILHKSSLK